MEDFLFDDFVSNIDNYDKNYVNDGYNNDDVDMILILVMIMI